jgi:hypothetical protein
MGGRSVPDGTWRSAVWSPGAKWKVFHLFQLQSHRPRRRTLIKGRTLVVRTRVGFRFVTGPEDHGDRWMGPYPWRFPPPSFSTPPPR